MEEIEQEVIKKKIMNNDENIGYNLELFKDWGIYISNKDKYDNDINIDNLYYN